MRSRIDRALRKKDPPFYKPKGWFHSIYARLNFVRSGDGKERLKSVPRFALLFQTNPRSPVFDSTSHETMKTQRTSRFFEPPFLRLSRPQNHENNNKTNGEKTAINFCNNAFAKLGKMRRFSNFIYFNDKKLIDRLSRNFFLITKLRTILRGAYSFGRLHFVERGFLLTLEVYFSRGKHCISILAVIRKRGKRIL